MNSVDKKVVCIPENVGRVFAAGERKKEKEIGKSLDELHNYAQALINGDHERAEEIMRETFGEDKNETEDH